MEAAVLFFTFIVSVTTTDFADRLKAGRALIQLLARVIVLSFVSSLLHAAEEAQWDGPRRAPDGTLEDHYGPPKVIVIRGKKALIHIRRNEGGFLSGLRIAFVDKKDSDILIDDMWAGGNWGLYVYDFDRDGNQDIMIRQSSAPNAWSEYYFYDSKTGTFKTRTDFDGEVGDYYPKTGAFCSYGRSGTSAGWSIHILHGGRLQKCYEGFTSPTLAEWKTWAPLGNLFVLKKSISEGAAEHFPDILPNAYPYNNYRVTTLYRPDGSIDRRFYCGIGEKRDLWDHPGYRRYARGTSISP